MNPEFVVISSTRREEEERDTHINKDKSHIYRCFLSTKGLPADPPPWPAPLAWKRQPLTSNRSQVMLAAPVDLPWFWRNAELSTVTREPGVATTVSPPTT